MGARRWVGIRGIFDCIRRYGDRLFFRGEFESRSEVCCGYSCLLLYTHTHTHTDRGWFYARAADGMSTRVELEQDHEQPRPPSHPGQYVIYYNYIYTCREVYDISDGPLIAPLGSHNNTTRGIVKGRDVGRKQKKIVYWLFTANICTILFFCLFIFCSRALHAFVHYFLCEAQAYTWN